MSFGPTGIPEDAYLPSKRGRRAKGEDVDDSTLRRLRAEVEAPVGDISIVFTDIKGSTLLWETYPDAMRAAMKLHNDVMRRQLRLIGGYEVKTEGDAFMVSFPTATSALLWAFAVQSQLLEVQWPAEVLNSAVGKETFDNDGNLIYRGLRVRMGIHWGNPLCETDPVTRRMDYFGPMVNKTSRISSVADGGQMAVSQDFISEIQRCWEAFPDPDRSSSTGSDETFENDLYAQTIRRELNSLSLQGYEIKDMGERKLKGLENPEFIYLMYPHSLAGRIYLQPRLQIDTEEAECKLIPAHRIEDPLCRNLNLQLTIEPGAVWALWGISQRLEMLCIRLEEGPGSNLRPPHSEMLEKMKNGAGEVTDQFLIGFMSHLVARTEVCGSLPQIPFPIFLNLPPSSCPIVKEKRLTRNSPQSRLSVFANSPRTPKICPCSSFGSRLSRWTKCLRI
jgi:adenylate cyclase